MRLTRHALLAALLTTGATLGLSACTGNPTPINTSSAALTPSTTSTPTTSPTPTNPYPADVPLTGHNLKTRDEKPPLYPTAATRDDRRGADAFAVFYMQTLDWGYATTNPSYMRHYSGPSCGLCAGIATGIRKTAQDGHYYLGGRFDNIRSRPEQRGTVSAPLDYCTRVTIDIPAASVVDKSGRVFNGQGALRHQPFKLCEQHTAEGWRVTYLIGAA